MAKTKINFNQPKYIIGGIAYFGALLIGGLVLWLFDTEIEEVKDSNLQTTEYLNAELPRANVKENIGSKRENVRREFGDIVDRTAIDNIENDIDSVQKKLDFESRYSDEELRLIEEQKAKDAELARLREMEEKLKNSAKRGEEVSAMTDEDFELSLTDEDRQRLLDARRKAQLQEMQAELDRARAKGAEIMDTAQVLYADEVPKAVKGLDERQEALDVVKVTNQSSRMFNTISDNVQESHLISAIIDEDIKVVDGSRVRLRILDDIEISGVKLKKGSYLYAQMSGFGQQRIKGTVKSVMAGDEILKINLAIYDTDGMEGLYVPASSFRETAKDVGSTALQGNMNINSGSSTSNAVSQWAMMGLQNAYQRTSSAIAKAIKKNKVTIKYGTQVYLINTKEEKKR